MYNSKGLCDLAIDQGRFQISIKVLHILLIKYCKVLVTKLIEKTERSSKHFKHTYHGIVCTGRCCSGGRPSGS